MRSVSDAFAAAVFSSHRRVTVVTDMNTGNALPVVDGSVTLDITAATRGTADLEFHDPSLIPQTSNDVLAPYSTGPAFGEIKIERGILIGGAPELLTLGIFRVEETEINDTDGGVTIRVTLMDRSSRVIDAMFENPYSVTGGTVINTAIQDGITQAFTGGPTPTFKLDPKGAGTTPTLTGEEGADRWAFFQTMASAIGMDLYFDGDGVCVCAVIPSIDNTPKIAIVEGVAGATVQPSLLDVSKRWSRTDAFNKWIVTGDNPDTTGPPPRAEAIDDDPASPTRYSGTFGMKPDFYSSSFITDTTMATEAAEGRKAKEIGTSQGINFGSLVHPALEPGDVVRVTRTRVSPTGGARVKIADENYIIDSLTIPLGAGSMTATGRGKKVVA